jgi:hypothetical protein
VNAVREASPADDDEPGEPRGVDEIEPERLRAAYDEAIQLVMEGLPQRIYPSTRAWRVMSIAWVARMTGTLGALRLLIETGHRSEVEAHPAVVALVGVIVSAVVALIVR